MPSFTRAVIERASRQESESLKERCLRSWQYLDGKIPAEAGGGIAIIMDIVQQVSQEANEQMESENRSLTLRLHAMAKEIMKVTRPAPVAKPAAGRRIWLWTALVVVAVAVALGLARRIVIK